MFIISRSSSSSPATALPRHYPDSRLDWKRQPTATGSRLIDELEHQVVRPAQRALQPERQQQSTEAIPMTALLKTATVAIAVLLATPLTVLAQPDLPRSPETASPSQPLHRQSPEVRELEKLGEQLGRDLRAEIDTEALRRTLEPVARQSLRTFLDAAPDLSRSLVKLSEWYLKDLGDRAQRGLDRARQEID